MITYFKMKYREWKIKKLLYGSILAFIQNQEEIAQMIQKMYTALKDMPAEEFQKAFVSSLADQTQEEK